MTEVSITQEELAKTRQRLFDAAAAVFAERGFRNATVRDICERAGANVAAVNYHFGGKEQLYAEVCQTLFREALTRHPIGVGLIAGAPADEKFAFFVRNFVQRVLGEDPHGMHRIVVKELADPSGILPLVVEQMVRPQFSFLRSVIAELLADAEADEPTLDRCTFGVIGQCLFYRFAQPCVQALRPGMEYDAGMLGALVEHVIRFSLGGIRATKEALQAAKHAKEGRP